MCGVRLPLGPSLGWGGRRSVVFVSGGVFTRCLSGTWSSFTEFLNSEYMNAYPGS